MTVEELSNEFDVLVNSYSVQEVPGQEMNPLNFDEYEKSVFLTEAQIQAVTELYASGSAGFESTEQMRRYLSELIRTAEIAVKKHPGGISDNSVMAPLPERLMFITYEAAKLGGDDDCLNGKTIQVIPVAQDEYHRIKDNPFRRPNSRKALRLDIGDNMVELVSEYPITHYQVRYLERPYPIILTDLGDDLKIDNENIKTECKLNPGIHRTILELAVQNAIKSRSQGTKSN